MNEAFSKPVTKTLIMVLLLALAGGLAAADKPLLMEGKKTLFQRVLSVPDARLYEVPADTATSSAVIPFSVLYVYEKDGDWIKVGYNSFGQTAGWVKSDKAIDWNQALTVSFKDSQDMQRVMMFNSKDDLERLVSDYDKVGYQTLYESAVTGAIAKDSPIVAIQPMKTFISVTNRRVC
jgi:serine/threonine-protein kinase PpkA